MKLKGYIIIGVLLINQYSISSQTIVNPNYGLKSHETLEISKIEVTAAKTIVYLTIENRIEKGSFCADKNIYIIDPSGSKLKLRRAIGIPVCPESYQFSGIGDKLNFTLDFPPLKAGTKWIDIVEQCTSNCFWFYGITLDSELNAKLDEVFATASSGKSADNALQFKSILESIDNQNLGIEGLLYINIINSAVEDNDKVGAGMWYKRLASSKAPRLSNYLKYLNDKGIKY